MAEGIGWAGINEVPVVVTLYQRGGPSTGLPTRHEQGDLRFALHIGHGDVPEIVLASGDLEEAFYDTTKAFNYAEKYQVPVIHIVDKAMANSDQTYPMFDPSLVKIERGELMSGAASRRTRAHASSSGSSETESGISPEARHRHQGGIYWNTGDEHDEKGHISEDPTNRDMMMEKRMRKLDIAATRDTPRGEGPLLRAEGRRHHPGELGLYQGGDPRRDGGPEGRRHNRELPPAQAHPAVPHRVREGGTLRVRRRL